MTNNESLTVVASKRNSKLKLADAFFCICRIC